VVLSDWMAANLIQLGWAQPLSPALTPNAARLLPQFRDWPVPGVRHWAMAWQGGFTGIVYNEAVTHRPILRMRDLLTAPDLRGKVSLVTSMRDTLGLVMLDLGIDPSAFTESEFSAALAFLGQAARSGQIGAVTNYYPASLIRGKLAAAVGWAGDVLFAEETHPSIKFTWPRAGGMLWADQMVIPAYARHPVNAQKLMDFYYQPAIAAQVTLYERYLCPVLGTQPVVRRVDPAVAASPWVFPTPAVLRNGHYFKILTPRQGARYVSAYETTVGL
jgi:spermidine/putrescine transport system substrate-binding protein